MGRMDGKVVFITGAARGQGRAHAVRMAREGADVIALDACATFDTTSYPGATRADLDETARLVEELGRRVMPVVADVRNEAAVHTAVADGVAYLGRLDAVVANAGIATFRAAHEIVEHEWREIVDVNLTGVFHTIKAAVPVLLDQDHGGSVVLISSSGGRKGVPNCAHYTAAKHGVVGLMRACANEYGRNMIRFNSVHPTTVDTVLVQNEMVHRLLAPYHPHPGRDDVAPAFARMNALPVPWIDPEDVANAVLWLASDESRYVTGAEIPVDAGFHGKV